MAYCVPAGLEYRDPMATFNEDGVGKFTCGCTGVAASVYLDVDTLDVGMPSPLRDWPENVYDVFGVNPSLIQGLVFFTQVELVPLVTLLNKIQKPAGDEVAVRSAGVTVTLFDATFESVRDGTASIYVHLVKLVVLALW